MEPVIDSDSANEAIKIVKALEPKYRITEVPNPAYAKAKRDRQAFSPQRETIKVTDKPVHPSLAEQIQQREKLHTVRLLNIVCDVCQCCPEVSDCSWSCEVRAIDFCERVKRNLIYMGVIEK